MFFDFSRYKVSVLALIVLTLALSVSASYVLWHGTQSARIEMGHVLSHREAETSYWLFYKVPEGLVSLLAAAGLAQAQPAPAAPAGPAESVPVLLYHGEGASGITTPTQTTFVAQMRALKAAGWHTITLKQFTAFMKGTGTVPDKSFFLTFDDGRVSAYNQADPVLKDLSFTAVMFVITGSSLPDNSATPSKAFYLSKSQLAAMVASGRWELESHSVEAHRSYDVPNLGGASTSSPTISNAHFLSNKFWIPAENRPETSREFEMRITNDLAHAKATLQADFGAPVTAFAFPFNDFGQESLNFPGAAAIVAQVVRRLYTFAFFQTWAGNGDTFNYPNPNTYRIKRIEPSNSWSGGDLLAVLDGGRVKPLPYEAHAYGGDWGANWGAIKNGNALTLSATPQTTGAAAFLDGTETWTNYRIRANATVTAGTFSLVARHTENDDPYAVCAFANNYIYLERHQGQEQMTIAKARYAPPALPAAYSVAMTVAGPTVFCSAYGVSVRADIPGMLTAGGVGASVWDPEAAVAQAAITDFSVEPF